MQAGLAAGGGSSGHQRQRQPRLKAGGNLQSLPAVPGATTHGQGALSPRCRQATPRSVLLLHAQDVVCPRRLPTRQRAQGSMSQPYYDLCVSTALLEPQTQRERVSQAIMLGWDAVALVHQAAAKLTEQDRCGGASGVRSWQGCAGCDFSPPTASTNAACTCTGRCFAPFPPTKQHTLRAFDCASRHPAPCCHVPRCPIRPVELAALLAAAKGVREALAAAEARAGPRHGDPYTVRQLTRINIPVDDPAAAQVCGGPTGVAWRLLGRGWHASWQCCGVMGCSKGAGSAAGWSARLFGCA